MKWKELVFKWGLIVEPEERIVVERWQGARLVVKWGVRRVIEQGRVKCYLMSVGRITVHQR